MKFYHAITLAGVGLIGSPAAALYCYLDVFAQRPQCFAALAQLVYLPDGTLDRESLTITKAWEQCSITVNNPHKSKVTKVQIHATADLILRKCNPNSFGSFGFAGGSNVSQVPDVFLDIGNARSGPFSPNFPFNVSRCGLDAGAPAVLPSDCRAAYKAINANNIGHFIDHKGQLASSVRSTYKTCELTIYTTDESTLIGPKGKMYPSFEHMLEVCKSKSGVVNVPGGGSGLNGHTIIKYKYYRHEEPPE